MTFARIELLENIAFGIVQPFENLKFGRSHELKALQEMGFVDLEWRVTADGFNWLAANSEYFRLRTGLDTNDVGSAIWELLRDRSVD